MTRLGGGSRAHAEPFQSLFSVEREEATVCGHNVRRVTEDIAVMFDRGHEQRCVGFLGDFTDVGDETAVSLLTFTSIPNSVGRYGLPRRRICAYGSKMLMIFSFELVTPRRIRAHVCRTTD